MSNKLNIANKTELIIGIFLTIFSLILYFVIIPTQVTISVEKNFSSLYFPKAAVLVMLLISVTILLQSIFQLKRYKNLSENSRFNKQGILRVLAALVLIIVGYYGFKFFGYIVVTAFSIVGWMFLFREMNWKRFVIVSSLTPVISYYFFTIVMGVNLPRGILFDLLQEKLF